MEKPFESNKPIAIDLPLPSKPLLKATEIAKILNISRAFAYQLMREEVLPTVKILGVRRVRPEDLERFIQGNRFSK